MSIQLHDFCRKEPFDSEEKQIFVVSHENGNLYVWLGDRPVIFDKIKAVYLIAILYEYVYGIQTQRQTVARKTR